MPNGPIYYIIDQVIAEYELTLTHGVLRLCGRLCQPPNEHSLVITARAVQSLVALACLGVRLFVVVIAFVATSACVSSAAKTTSTPFDRLTTKSVVSSSSAEQLQICRGIRLCSSRECVSREAKVCSTRKTRAHLGHTAPRNPSAQGYTNQQQYSQQPGAVGSPMLSPPVGFSPQQARAGSLGHFQQQGTIPPRSPVMMQAQMQPSMHVQGQPSAPFANQGYNSRQPSYNNAPDVAGLEQHMSHMNMASPGLQAQQPPYVCLICTRKTIFELIAPSSGLPVITANRSWPSQSKARCKSIPSGGSTCTSAATVPAAATTGINLSVSSTSQQQLRSSASLRKCSTSGTTTSLSTRPSNDGAGEARLSTDGTAARSSAPGDWYSSATA